MRTGLWSPEQDARLAALYADGLPGREIAERLNAEFGTAFTKNSVLGRKRRLKLPECPQRRLKLPECPQRRAKQSGWTPERRQAQAARLARYWQDRRTGETPQPKKQFVFETVEQFLARGGQIKRNELQPDSYPAGTPVFPTGARHYASAP